MFSLNPEDEALAQRFADQARDMRLEQQHRDHEPAVAAGSVAHAVAPIAVMDLPVGLDSVEPTSRDEWRLLIRRVACHELGVPENLSYRLNDHPVMKRALELVGAESQATPAEIEAHRPPALRLSKLDEATARHIASLTLDSILPDIKPLMGRGPAAVAVQAQIVICARPYTGDRLDPTHPLVLRAEQLIPGLLSRYDTEISEFAARPADAACLYERALTSARQRRRLRRLRMSATAIRWSSSSADRHSRPLGVQSHA